MILTTLNQLPYLAQLTLGLAAIFLICLFLLFLVLFKLQRATVHFALKSRQYNELSAKQSTVEKENQTLRTAAARYSAQLRAERQSHQEKIDLLEDARNNLSIQFENLAQRIFEEKSSKFGAENKEKIESLLQPLQNQLNDFKKRAETIRTEDIKERTSLKQEIIHLRELNNQMSQEAINLTRALQGDQKTQGTWGELVLERILEKSGLRKDIEYSVQGGFRDKEHKLLKPDVLIKLPGHKQIIVDSKVSLSAWEKYTAAENLEEKAKYLEMHIASLRRHIKTLSTKNYPDLKNIVSLDFVLLFLPIDASFTEASKEIPNLFAEAYEQHIIIVTPTTLLVTLRTIENLWRYQQQQDNAGKIAESAGLLYNKFCGFLDDMEKIGKQLSTCTTTYEHAMNKLTTGRGNLVSQAHKLTEMGVSTQKNIPTHIRNEAHCNTLSVKQSSSYSAEC